MNQRIKNMRAETFLGHHVQWSAYIPIQRRRHYKIFIYIYRLPLFLLLNHLHAIFDIWDQGRYTVKRGEGSMVKSIYGFFSKCRR